MFADYVGEIRVTWSKTLRIVFRWVHEHTPQPWVNIPDGTSLQSNCMYFEPTSFHLLPDPCLSRQPVCRIVWHVLICCILYCTVLHYILCNRLYWTEINSIFSPIHVCLGNPCVGLCDMCLTTVSIVLCIARGFMKAIWGLTEVYEGTPLSPGIIFRLHCPYFVW